jgi:hypothetical protein
LPFFIQWGDDMPFPGATPVRHPGGPATLKRLIVTGNPKRVGGWLGDHDLPLSVSDGPSGLTGLVLTRLGRDFALLARPPTDGR